MSSDIPDILKADLRPVDTEWAISVLRKYLEVMEAQMEEVLRCERVALEAERPRNGDEEEHQLFSTQENALEEIFDRDLTPAMRYSFVVLLHTVFETRLRAFCTDMQRERGIPLTLAEVRGSALEQASTYLTKLAKLTVGNVPEWQHLRAFQKVRDCIVHVYGYVADSRDRAQIESLARPNTGVAIDDNGRLALTKAFCEQYLDHVAKFFDALFQAAGWRS